MLFSKITWISSFFLPPPLRRSCRTLAAKLDSFATVSVPSRGPPMSPLAFEKCLFIIDVHSLWCNSLWVLQMHRVMYSSTINTNTLKIPLRVPVQPTLPFQLLANTDFLPHLMCSAPATQLWVWFCPWSCCDIYMNSFQGCTQDSVWHVLSTHHVWAIM